MLFYFLIQYILHYWKCFFRFNEILTLVFRVLLSEYQHPKTEHTFVRCSDASVWYLNVFWIANHLTTKQYSTFKNWACSVFRGGRSREEGDVSCLSFVVLFLSYGTFITYVMNSLCLITSSKISRSKGQTRILTDVHLCHENMRQLRLTCRFANLSE